MSALGPPPVLVTGPTGTVGGPLVGFLAARGMTVVAGVRDPGRLGEATEERALDLERPETFDAALRGIGRLFLMRPPALAARHLRPFVEAAAARGVEHVVFLSVMGVNRALPHWRTEQDLRASPMVWTFLRPSFFAQNLETAYRADIRDHSAIRAAVAASVLHDPSPHVGQAYTLTGPAALDYHQVASMLSAELGRAVVYEPQTLVAYRRELRRTGLPDDYVTVQLVINLVARLGFAGRVTDTVDRLLGRPPTPLATYLHDRRDRWMAS